MRSKGVGVAVVVGWVVTAVVLVMGQEMGVRERFVEAVMRGDVEAVRQLIQEGAAVNAADELGYTPLMLAVRKGHELVVRVLMEAGADVRAVNLLDGGRTALHYAGLHGRREIAQMLIAGGANVEARARGGMTPLGSAAAVGASEVVRVLIEAGAEVDAAQDERGWTPLMLALEQGQIETARVLLEAGADARRPGVLEAAARSGDVEMIRDLAARGAPFGSGEGGESPPVWHVALWKGHVQAAMALRRAYLERQGQGRSPEAMREERLLRAAWEGDERTVRRLVAGGALVGDESVVLASDIAAVGGRINVLRVLGGLGLPLEKRLPERELRAELERAIWFGDVEWAEQIILLGADPRMETAAGRPILFDAIETGRREMVDLLLRWGADPNAWDRRRKLSAVGAALAWGRMEVYQLLRERGAGTEKLDESTALWRAIWNRQGQGVRVLLELGVNPNRKVKLTEGYEVPPLVGAACWGDEEVVRWLVEAGAEVDATDSVGATALAHAMVQQRHEAARVLREAGAKEPAELRLPAYWWAIGHQDMERLKELAAAGVPIDRERDPLEGLNPVRLAIQVGWPEGATALLEAGARVSPPPEDREYPKPLLMSAVERASSQDPVWANLLEELIRRGENVNAVYVPQEQVGPYPSTALMMAAYLGKAEIVNLLLIRGADPTIRDAQGRDAVAWSEMEQRPEGASRLPAPGSATGRERSRRTIAVAMEQRGTGGQGRR